MLPGLLVSGLVFSGFVVPVTTITRFSVFVALGFGAFGFAVIGFGVSGFAVIGFRGYRVCVIAFEVVRFAFRVFLVCRL